MLKDIQDRIEKMLCWCGLHKFDVIEVRFGFGKSGNIEHVECVRCGIKMTRPARSS